MTLRIVNDARRTHKALKGYFANVLFQTQSFGKTSHLEHKPNQLNKPAAPSSQYILRIKSANTLYILQMTKSALGWFETRSRRHPPFSVYHITAACVRQSFNISKRSSQSIEIDTQYCNIHIRSRRNSKQPFGMPTAVWSM